MKKHELHVITTGKQKPTEVAAIATQIPTHLIDVLHLREKQCGARELTDWYHTLQPLFDSTAIYMNDRLDAALAVGAPGVQLAYNSLSITQSRRILPASVRIGCSVHSAEEAAAAAQQGADYVLYGHIFDSSSKPGLPPRGIAALSEVVDACSIPVIAIGGIEPDNVDEVLSTGCSGIAVLSRILLHHDPAGQLVRFHEMLGQTRHIPKHSLMK
ncbi:thiamine phosphate synthase [Paenibacillus radicis (ex Xue et al. 2023)]|uniref:Thiamine phosphate synthase n=1 Tax=Paenibacillus radicis (ex Xue et al. 2023) TaxID=2972489 RepID=A0ABT1YCW4_9BACL|nr:thiamine phosphate synthase [Paenibacillus radicis (ex Xue et al. 2023)]MCR8631028.1 thiamine phosphate synthase [Paenibacillus radicis (ex Xue et al. 2023)]